MSRAFAVTGGLMFVGSLVCFAVSYAWRFGGVIVPWSAATAWRAGLIDAAMFSVFALHHSLFARTGLKARITSLVPPVLERSIYVWIASLLFVLVCALWRPVPGLLWRTSGLATGILLAAQAVAAIFTVAAARRLDVLELAGIRQVFDQSDRPSHGVDERGPYGLVRHPIYLGWFAMVWGAPVMNGTRLMFAAISCAYLVMAIPFEERDLRRTFGAPYEAYMRRVRWKIIPGIY